MIIENNKIIEATQNELFEYYLKQGYEDIMSFTDYLQSVKESGTKIINEVLI